MHTQITPAARPAQAFETYTVKFETRNRRRACSASASVEVVAASERDAETTAARFLRLSGENIANFYPPVARLAGREAA